MTACKDIPDEPILKFLDGREHWANSFGDGNADSVLQVFPAGTPWKLARAKMNSLIHRGLVNGCSAMHNCRGDYELTEDGAKALRGRA